MCTRKMVEMNDKNSSMGKHMRRASNRRRMEEREREQKSEKKEWSETVKLLHEYVCACTLANFPMLCHFAPVFHIRSLCRPFTPTNVKLFIKLYGIKLLSNYASLRIKMTRHIFSSSLNELPATHFHALFFLLLHSFQCVRWLQLRLCASEQTSIANKCYVFICEPKHTQIGIRMLSHSNANI